MNIRSIFEFVRIALGLMLVCSLALGDASPASAEGPRCYVNVNAAGGGNTGGSWVNAYTDLQFALGTSACTEVWVAKGTYRPTGAGLVYRMASFVLKSGVALYGGFAGTETLLSERNPAANVTVLSGDIGAAGDPADNSYHVVVGSGTDNTAVLDGFTITAGNASVTEENGTGGGMLNYRGSPHLANVILTGNFAIDAFGGLDNYYGSPSLTNVTFSGNQGGGMVSWGGSPTLVNVTFSGNSGVGMSNSYGSPSLTNVMFNANSGRGMDSHVGSPSLTNVTFSGNEGGGMASMDGNPTLVNVTFSSNATSAYGGGMDNWDGSPILINVTFSNNSAQRGGGMYNWSGSPRLTNVTFNNNSAWEGGGIYDDDKSSLTNVTFSGNVAFADGGGMHSGDSPRLTNVTFSGNSASRGGGIYSDSGSPILINSILYGNIGGEIYNAEGSGATVNYSIVQGGYPGTGNLNTDPLLQPLGDNGGFTETMALGAGSPAIEAGTNSGCPAKDQRGVVRPQGQRCDMGAYEYEITLMSLSLYSAGAYDGWVLESGEGSGVGGGLNPTGSALVAGDTAQDRQYRSILSFKTGLLPDDAVITSAVLKLKGAGVAGTNPFSTHGSLLVDVRKGTFGDAALQVQDFEAVANKSAMMTILNKPVNGWYTQGLGPGGLMRINKAGPTQFRLRFAVDDNDDGAADYVKFYSGNVTTAAYRPQLIIRYYVP